MHIEYLNCFSSGVTIISEITLKIGSLEAIVRFCSRAVTTFTFSNFTENINIFHKVPTSFGYKKLGFSGADRKRLVKLTRFKNFLLELSGHQDIPLLSFVLGLQL